MQNKTASHWPLRLMMGVLLFLGYSSLGAYLALVKHYIPYDALARLVSAFLVFYGTQMKLATIGFVWPPVPTLVILPLAAIKPLVHSWMAVVLVSAFFMALACFMIDRIASLCGLSRGWRIVVDVLFALNPLMIVFGANGMSEAILIAATTGGMYWLIRFWKTERNMDLIMTAGFFSMLPLIRYETALLTAFAGVMVFFHSWSVGRKRYSINDFRDFVEGRLLGYSGLAIYPVFIWAVACWFIMGSPLYFLLNDRSAVSLADMSTASLTDVFYPGTAHLSATFGIWAALFPLGLVGSIAGLYLGIRRKSPLLTGLALFPFIIPALQYALLVRNATVPLLRYFVMAVPLGLVAALAAWSEWDQMRARSIASRRTASALVCVFFLLSNLSSARMLTVYPFQNIERNTWLALTTNQAIDNQQYEDSEAVGKALKAIIPAGSRVLVDTYQFGFAVLLGAGDPKLFMDFTDPDYDAAVLHPQGYVDYLIVPETSGRGALYSINHAHPSLHADGAPWAELVDGLPPSSLNWKLYKVISP